MYYKYFMLYFKLENHNEQNIQKGVREQKRKERKHNKNANGLKE